MTQPRVYLLNPQSLTPETIAVAFAKTSRSPEAFDVIAADLTETRSSEFHEKWVVGYGHASVAEHAVLHLAVENISRLAVECLESNRLASYTEKSSRYQKWHSNSFHSPIELQNNPLQETYHQTCKMLFESYLHSLPLVEAVVKKENPQEKNETITAWERRIRSEYIDVSRYYLPSSSLANVGVTINARALAHALRKMLSNPLVEVQQMGEAIKKISLEEVPTLLKYVDPVPYLQNIQPALKQAIGNFHTAPTNSYDWCKLVDYDPEGETKVLAAALYRYDNISFSQALELIQAMNAEQKRSLAEIVLGTMAKHDIPIRELEYTNLTFDVCIDQGAYFELKRHRMMTQSVQNLTVEHGYAVPRRITAAGLEDEYHHAMAAAADTYHKIYEFAPEAAAYVVPNAYNRRVLLSMNMRSAIHLLNLRAASNAHFAIRRLARRMEEQIKSVYPLLGTYLPLQPVETVSSIEQDYFSQT